MIDQYLDEYEKLRPLGKTKRATLNAIKKTWLGDLEDEQITSQKLVEYALKRIESDDIQPQTVGMIWLIWEQYCLSRDRHGNAS